MTEYSKILPSLKAEMTECSRVPRVKKISDTWALASTLSTKSRTDWLPACSTSAKSGTDWVLMSTTSTESWNDRTLAGTKSTKSWNDWVHASLNVSARCHSGHRYIGTNIPWHNIEGCGDLVSVKPANELPSFFFLSIYILRSLDYIFLFRILNLKWIQL